MSLMPPEALPKVTVVIPTYNWSAALRCAIQSVLLQTEQDFEVLVVGDGCTDDSEDVVAAFGDPRLRWHNLDRNHGSQWAANNHALEHASADWIAYLGHDDIWYPTHLVAVLETARRTSAEIVTSAMIMYGPPHARVHGIAGVFPDNQFRPNYFVPPSAFSHAKALYGDVIQWRDPDTLALPMDAAFLNELALANRPFASTLELTCFKFNAAFRRDSYVSKPIAEQEAMLERIRSEGDFRHAELLKVLESVVSDRIMVLLDPSVPTDTEKGAVVRRNRRFKGLDDRFAPERRRIVSQPLRFDMSFQDSPFEWHAPEGEPGYACFRWTGPSTRVTIDLPIVFDRDLEIRLKLIATLDDAIFANTTLSVHGRRLDVNMLRDGTDVFLVADVAKESVAEGSGFGVTVDTGRVIRPFDLGISADRRWLGVAIAWIELRPVQAMPYYEDYGD